MPGRIATGALIIAGIGLAAALYERGATTSSPAGATSAPPTPVVAVLAHTGDIGVYVTGLGAVTPLNTVTVTTRVDGQLMTVSYKEGAGVRKGDPLVDIDPRPYQVQLAQAEGQLARDQAALQNARIDLQRYEALIATSAVTQQTLATQRATVIQDEGAVKIDQAAIDSARLNLAYCHITAPLTGRVGLRLVDPGNLVTAAAGTPLAVITQTQPISVIFTIPEQQVDSVLEAIRGGRRLTVDVFDRGLQHALASGALTTVDNEIDPTTGTLKLRAIVPNTGELLVANQFVNARLTVQKKTGVTLVSNAAIQRNGSATFVYLVAPDRTVAVKTVAVGTAGAEESEIVSGLAPKDVVVTQGVDKLQAGSPVAVQLASDPSP
jgi:multidrug efflux system membrane fusion protein